MGTRIHQQASREGRSAVIHAAYTWYMAEPERRIEDAARRYALPATTLADRFRRAGLPAKAQHRREAVRCTLPRPVAEQRALEAYRAGTPAEELGPRFGLGTQAVLRLLQDAGESCAHCGILFRETADGIALSAGRRVCQDCVQVYGLSVERWEREPVDLVSDYAELAGCYAYEGAR